MSAPSDSASQKTASTPSAPERDVVNDVGLQFLREYYNMVTKDPHRLHCFYTKNSTFIHGLEGDEHESSCHGQQKIHQQILKIGYEDTKTFIHSIDSQSSSGGGIIILAIGEQSNRGEPFRKFAQSFFLAPQPNGYYVLNDIFRYLKEDDLEFVEGEAPEESVEPATDVVSTNVEQELEPAEEPPVDIPPTILAPEPTETIPEPSYEPKAEASPAVAEEVPQPKPNGVHVEPKPEPEEVEEPQVAEVEPEPESPAAEHAPEPAAQPTPPSQPPAASVAEPTPIRAQPEGPKTWANLAKTNQTKWGSNVAQESRAVSIDVKAAPSPPPSQPARSNTQTPTLTTKPRNYHQGQSNEKEPLTLQDIEALTTSSVFVKGLVDPITNDQLKAKLIECGGPIKKIEYNRSRACAFVDFETLESAKKALTASLFKNQGGGGGIFINVEDRRIRIYVDLKRPREERPPPRNNRGTPNQNFDRGSFRGGNKPRGRGRGAPAASGKVM